MIFLVKGLDVSENGYNYLIFIINLDWIYDEEHYYMWFTDFYNYQDELKELKDLNNWNKPYK